MIARSPVTLSSPAAIATCEPKLRLRLMARTRGSRARSCSMTRIVPSVEPSSTNTSSQRCPNSESRTTLTVS